MIVLLVVGGGLLALGFLLRVLVMDRTRIEELAGAAVVEELEGLAQQAVEIGRDIEWFAAPALRGRDTPSVGLTAAQLEVARRFHGLGLQPIPLGVGAVAVPGGVAGQAHATRGSLAHRLREEGLPAYALPFEARAVEFGRRALSRPSEVCSLTVVDGETMELGVDFIPLADAAFSGMASGELVLVGYGIHSASEGYDDLAGLELAGKVAVVLLGEPRITGRFGGSEETAEAALWNKLDALSEAGAAGALVVDQESAESVPGYSASYASWMPPTFDRVRGGLPTLLVSGAVGQKLLGVAPLELAEEIAASAAPPGRSRRDAVAGRHVRFVAGIETGPQWLANVAALVPGRSSGGRGAVLIGAHLDHVGVGPRGRIGFGADDNASGAAALLSIASRLAAAPAARDVWLVGFCGEEDGLMGSRAMASALDARRPGAVELMINLDMVGRGPTDGAVVLRGAPDAQALNWLDGLLEGALSEAGRPRHGLASLRVVEDRGFFQRSDHYAFHEVGIPNVFLFEDWPLSAGIYHTWRDTPDTVDALKVARTARFAEAVARQVD